MAEAPQLPADKPPLGVESDQDLTLTSRVVRWVTVFAAGCVVLLIPIPEGITAKSWHLLAIFVATIVGSIVRPIPGGAMVLLGVSALALTGTLPVASALAGYADPIVWLVLAAFFISRAMIKTGLGRRIALIFIRTIGHHSLGLAYALISTEVLLGTMIPSTGARAGGVLLPIARSLSEAYESRPGATARRLGAFLMVVLYQAGVIVCAMFLTGQASNVLIAKFAFQTTGIELTYTRWALAALVPGLVSLAVIPPLIYRIFPPEVKHTPAAAEFARTELQLMGRMKRSEKILLIVFFGVTCLWLVRGLGGTIPFVARVVPVTQFISALSYLATLDYSVPPLLGVCVLLISRVLDWVDIVSERGAWDVFIWYGGLVRMAESLGETGITKRFAETAASFTVGWKWGAALAVLLLIYFYAHYGFASITAHSTAMYTPFLVVILAAGAPPYLAVLSLAYFSNLDASLTHFGTTSAPIYFGAGYVSQRKWWSLGLIASLVNIPIWVGFGFVWWKILKLW
ncbi:MAG TPA: DASS family sodium-coupled anion symporter [Pyrinomonadaceae bacterium]|nr:DASS family sodium-coupled anion symporter [Pyrinomonadaceae bacterium]